MFDWEKLKKYIPRITWQESDEILHRQHEEVLTLLQEFSSTNRALNIALGQSIEEMDKIREEAVVLLTAIVLKHGGELKVEPAFFDILADKSNPSKLKIERDNEDNVCLKLIDEGDEDAEVSDEDAERNQQ